MLFGSGVLRGMQVTLKNLICSYFKKPDQGGLFTVEYPEKRLPVKPTFRNLPFLVYDENPSDPRCTACDICAKECPPKCIYIVRENDENGKPLKKPAIFNIDFSVCMNCGLCEEACPFDSIYMDHDFEISHSERQEGLLATKDMLLKSNAYFHQIRPGAAAAIDKRRAETEAKKKAAAEAAAAKRAQAAHAQQAEPKPPANPPSGPGTGAAS